MLISHLIYLTILISMIEWHQMKVIRDNYGRE